jgi:hypothetical protein
MLQRSNRMHNLPPELWLIVFRWALDFSSALHIDPLSDVWTDSETRYSPWNSNFQLRRKTAVSIALVCKAWLELSGSFHHKYESVSTLEKWTSLDTMLVRRNAESPSISYPASLEVFLNARPSHLLHADDLVRPFGHVSFENLQALSLRVLCECADDGGWFPNRPTLDPIVAHFGDTLHYLEFRCLFRDDYEYDWYATDPRPHILSGFRLLEVVCITLPDDVSFPTLADITTSPLCLPFVHSLSLKSAENGLTSPWLSWLEIGELPALSCMCLDARQRLSVTTVLKKHGANLRFLHLINCPTEPSEALVECVNLQQLVAPFDLYRDSGIALPNLKKVTVHIRYVGKAVHHIANFA